MHMRSLGMCYVNYGIPPKSCLAKWPWFLQLSSCLVVPMCFISMIIHSQNLICLLNVACKTAQMLAEHWDMAAGGGMTAFLILHTHSPLVKPIFWKILFEKKIVMVLPCEQREKRPSSHWPYFVFNVALGVNTLEINVSVLVSLI